MTNKALKDYFFSELSAFYPKNEMQSFFHLLAEDRLKLSRAEFALNYSHELKEEDLVYFEKSIADLKRHLPIQYILGYTHFYGLEIKVNASVLIPRPETEELVAWIIEDYKPKHLTSENQQIKILDIGTGSGCIAISLKKNLPDAEVYALDIDSKALAVAKNNANLNNCSINFIKSDILTGSELPQTFDIIVSNPPYVREQEKKEIQANVLEHEPHLALFVKNEDPLLFYDKIADLAKIFLTLKGTLYFEINQYLGDAMKALLKSKGFKDLELRKDIFGVNRMIKTCQSTIDQM